MRSNIFLQWMRLNAARALTTAGSLRAVDLCLDADTLQAIYEKSEQSAAEGTISFFLFRLRPPQQLIIEVKIAC